MSARDAAARARAFGRRYRLLRVAAVLLRFARGVMPRWLQVALGAAVATPLPFDDIVAAAVALAFLVWALRSADARRELAGSVQKAWRK